MVPLNESTNWGEVGAVSTGAGSVSDAFKSKHAEKVLLTPGTKLYKFNDFNSPTRAGSKALSPWWSPYDDYQHDGGWEQRKKLATLLGVSIREFGRVTSAVKENWNSLQYLLVVTLSQPAYAYYGDFAQMPRADAGEASKRVTTAPAGGGSFLAESRGATKNLPGGGTQFYIPNFTTDEISGWSVESLLAS
jgi:hypothetical protein